MDLSLFTHITPAKCSENGNQGYFDNPQSEFANKNSDEPKKKRKTYQITKPRQPWTEEEHDRFVEGVKLFGRDWKKVELHMGTKSISQVRSHAQKTFHYTKQGDDVLPAPRFKKQRKNSEQEEFNDQDDENDQEIEDHSVNTLASNPFGLPDFGAIYMYLSNIFDLNVTELTILRNIASLSSLEQEQQICEILMNNIVGNLN